MPMSQEDLNTDTAVNQSEGHQRRCIVRAIYPHEVEKARREASWIISAIAESHNLTKADIIGHDRRAHVVVARYEAISAVHKTFPNWSYPVLGMIFNRDHTTIMHALKKLGVWVPKGGDHAGEPTAAYHIGQFCASLSKGGAQ
jgi:hypothetical protein